MNIPEYTPLFTNRPYPLHFACGSGNVAEVEHWLNSECADCRLEFRAPNGVTPLHVAFAAHASACSRGGSFAANRTRAVIELLLARGADLLAMDAQGRLPYSLADGHSWPAMVATMAAAVATAVATAGEDVSARWVPVPDSKDRHKLIKDKPAARGYEKRKPKAKTVTTHARVPAVESPAVAAAA
jgi:ankyrin repeat protein